jgi:hypothetical protein
MDVWERNKSRQGLRNAVQNQTGSETATKWWTVLLATEGNPEAEIKEDTSLVKIHAEFILQEIGGNRFCVHTGWVLI